MKKIILMACLGISLCFVSAGVSEAYEIPRDNSNVQLLYVFGPEANPQLGAEDHTQSVFIDIPEDESERLVVKVYDPDTWRTNDWKYPWFTRWNTGTVFQLYGKRLVAERVFPARDKEYNKQYFTFGPFDKTLGEKVGNVYRFQLVAKATTGDDQNLFSVQITPDTAEAFSDNITFRLIEGVNEKMYFYPFIPNGTTEIVVENYDLDPDGGTSVLEDSASNKSYPVRGSGSGQWSQTALRLESGPARFLSYIITKGTQDRGNAGLRVRDAQGNLLPVYFRGPGPRPEKPVPAPLPEKKPAPVPSGLPCNTFTFDATESYDPNDKHLSYSWDFGDGAASDQSTVTHVYEKGGTYTVTLTVTDDSGLHCQSAMTSQVIQVNTPPTADFAAPELACVDQTVTLDASASKDAEAKQLAYAWSFDDGTTATGQKITKAFMKGGVYKILLKVDDEAGTSCSTDAASRIIRVNTPPVAQAGQDISLCLSDPKDDYAVTFDASGSYDADSKDLTYQWDFGDGTRETAKKVTHIYPKGGDYTAKLMVTDPSGSSCNTASDTVKVSLSKSPVAVAGVDQNVCAGSVVAFDGSKSIAEEGDQLTYNWNFGDGETAAGKMVEHRYAKGGTYTALLTVDNGKGTPCSTSTDSLRVDVNASPKAVLDRVDVSCVGDRVDFDASGSSDADGDGLRYTWDFGDGTVVQGESEVNHKYAKGGTYRVKVSVDDGSDLSCAVDQAGITVKVNTPPIADAGPNLACCEDQSTAFDGSGSKDPDGDALTYSWDFGDGANADTAKASHSYKEYGDYRVVLTVDDGSGTACSSSRSSFVADVNAQPVSVIKIKQQ